MNRERLQTKVRKVRKKIEHESQTSERKVARADRRNREKLISLHSLAERNSVNQDRIRRVAGSGIRGVILEKEDGRTTFATIRTWYSSTGGAGVAFFNVSNDEYRDVLDKIRGDEDIDRQLDLLSNKLCLGREESYRTYGHNTIVERGLRDTSDGKIANPLKVVAGSIRRACIEECVTNLEQSLDIIEQAAVNRDLNPVLAERLAAESSPASQIVAQ
jgi:hypothetical protein